MSTLGQLHVTFLDSRVGRASTVRRGPGADGASVLESKKAPSAAARVNDASPPAGGVAVLEESLRTGAGCVRAVAGAGAGGAGGLRRGCAAGADDGEGEDVGGDGAAAAVGVGDVIVRTAANRHSRFRPPLAVARWRVAGGRLLRGLRRQQKALHWTVSTALLWRSVALGSRT